MTARTSPRKIGLMGPFGYGNLGDAAIQEAMIQHLRLIYPQAEIIGYSLNPADTQARHGIRSFPISRMSWVEHQVGLDRKTLAGKLAAWLRSHPNSRLRSLERWAARVPLEVGLLLRAYRDLEGVDLLIVSGGGQLDDYWGGGGPWSHPYTLLKWGAIARLRGARFQFVSVGAGPIAARLSRSFIKLALSLAEYRSYRDLNSKLLIHSIGFHRDDPIYPDLAHSLRVSPNGAHLAAGKPRPVVAIGPVGYYKQGSWPEEDDAIYAEYLEKLVSFTGWLIGKGYAITFLPGEAYFDGLAINDLKDRLKERGLAGQTGQLIETSIQTLDDLLCQLYTTDLVVASRFHNILLAQLLEKPVLALTYQDKIDSLMADTGQVEYCFPIGRFDLPLLKERFLALEANRDAISKQVRMRVQQYQSALDEQYERIFEPA